MNSILTGHDIGLTGPAIHLIAQALQGEKNESEKTGWSKSTAKVEQIGEMISLMSRKIIYLLVK